MATSDLVVISVGTVVSISLGAPATYDVSGFSAKSYTQVGEATSVPDFGGTAQVTEHIPLDTGVVNKRAGSFNYGSVQIPVARVEDAGQALVSQCFDGSSARQVISVKLTNADVGDVYFTGIITADQTSIGDANTIYGGSFTVELTNKLITTGNATIYTLTYTAGANGSIVGVSTQTVADGEDGVAVYAAPDSGYVFDEWSDASTDNPRTDTSVSADVTVSAAFVSE